MIKNRVSYLLGGTGGILWTSSGHVQPKYRFLICNKRDTVGVNH